MLLAHLSGETALRNLIDGVTRVLTMFSKVVSWIKMFALKIAAIFVIDQILKLQRDLLLISALLLALLRIETYTLNYPFSFVIICILICLLLIIHKIVKPRCYFLTKFYCFGTPTLRLSAPQDPWPWYTVISLFQWKALLLFSLKLLYWTICLVHTRTWTILNPIMSSFSIGWCKLTES